MAFVLSNFRDFSSCTGQKLIKYDPVLFSTLKTWNKTTIGNSSNNCGNLGLTFGRFE